MSFEWDGNNKLAALCDTCLCLLLGSLRWPPDVREAVDKLLAARKESLEAWSRALKVRLVVISIPCDL
jgi:hypothetical protein